MNRIPLIIYEGDDNSMGRDVYNLNRILRTEQIDLQKRDKNGKLKSVVCNTDIIADKTLGITSILDNKEFKECFEFFLALDTDIQITIDSTVAKYLQIIKQYLPDKKDMYVKGSNIINISGYKDNNIIVICTPEGYFKINIDDNSILISVDNPRISLSTNSVMLDSTGNVATVSIDSNTTWTVN